MFKSKDYSMSKLGSHYVDTSMNFGSVPSGFKFLMNGCLYLKYTSGIVSYPAHTAIDNETGQPILIADDVQVVCWYPRHILEQREREQTEEWKRRFEEVQEGIDERDDWEEPVLVIDGEREPRLQFIPVR
jgi:hypothetical protein